MVIQDWWLILDLTLGVLLTYVSVRLIRLPTVFQQSRRLRDLEVSLRSLVREATAAGGGLNEELLRRKQELEKLLMDLEHTGTKISSVKDSALRVVGELKNSEIHAQESAEQILANLKAECETIKAATKKDPFFGTAPAAPSFKGSVQVREKADEFVPVKKKDPVLHNLLEKQVTAERSSKTNSDRSEPVYRKDLPEFPRFIERPL